MAPKVRLYLLLFPLYVFGKLFLIFRVRVIYVGDDVTDEDAMRDLKGLGFSFKISSSTLSMTNADRILPGTDSVVKLLEWVEDTVVKRSGVDTEIGINN